MNHDTASELLEAVSWLNDLLVRQNVVCTTYISARRQCQQELSGTAQTPAVEYNFRPTVRFARILGDLAVEMHSIAHDHEGASLTIEQCAGHIHQWSPELTPASIELIMALLQSLIESTEVVFSRVELLNEFRDAAEVLLQNSDLQPQALAFTQAFDKVIGAYNHQWFAANDLVNALKRYANPNSHWQQPTENKVGKTEEEIPSFLQPDASLHSIEVEHSQTEIEEPIPSHIYELEERFTRARKQAQEAREQAEQIRAQCVETRNRLGQIFRDASQACVQAKEIHKEARETLQWLRTL